MRFHVSSAAFLLLFGRIAAFSADTELDRRFAQTVRPFVNQYCKGCHSGASAAAQLDLTTFTDTASVLQDFPHWTLLLERLSAQEMPPKGMPQPPAERRRQVMAWIKAVRADELRKNAGDPGLVLARRLSNAEYNYTIRDLTGVDLKPTREFPADPANQSGFDNSGESLSMSPSLLSKYLEAAREVADHMVLRPDGIFFALHPMLVETDRDKYAVSRILSFYARQRTDLADYFHAAWRYKHRAALGLPKATLASIAAEMKVSGKYLPLVWQILEETKEEFGPGAKLQAMWRELPVANASQSTAARDHFVKLREFVVKIRKHTAVLSFPPTPEGIRGGGGGGIVFSMWKNKMVAASHRDFDPASLRVEGEPPRGELVVTRGPTFGAKEVAALKVAVEQYTRERHEDPDLVIPAGQRERYEAAFKRFSSVFPDRFYLHERGRFYPVDVSTDTGRVLSAGLHNQMGYFRDDTALVELILDEKATQELDTLWDEFEYIADYSRRTYVQSSGSMNATLRTGYAEVGSQAAIFANRDMVLERFGAAPDVEQAIRDHYEGTNAAIRRAERRRLESEPHHLDALLKLAARAYRRPLTQGEREDILAYYRELRDKSAMSHEDAIRASIVSLLVSPDFCYRVDLVSSAVRTTGAGTRPLNAYALASRLSYFLWSSMPDEELLSHAAAGDLSKPPVLGAQVRRMLKDPRARGLATEFAGNWLDFRRFQSHNAVDRERFPSFTNQVREAMFEEPIRFVSDLLRNDRPVLDLLYGDYTFVNSVLAKHYGMTVDGGADDWVRVDNAKSWGRGGVLPMSVFLTQNAPGLRTSPVKRGYWVVRRVLGEVIPPPPPTVPELPQDESKSHLSVRDMLAQHRQNPACASCHARFDTFGLAFEGYGPVGERRTKDLAGRAVDTSASFPGGSQGTGLEGLQTYIRTHREKDFVTNLSGKMLAYALGRSLLLTDEPLLERARLRLSQNGYRISTLLETIVNSPQFLNRRDPDSPHAPRNESGGN